MSKNKFDDNLGSLLTAYLDGQLSDDRRQHVERLCADDPNARELLAQLCEVSAAVRQLPAETP